ncbi:hypothetical protein U8527_20870 [Kordia algicida OT-1]|uniref:Plasmid stabilization system n=1 Tax=Kordia algicida OT-1 TaxID=391587 RepID=A9DL21_9FLAO|nr:hypothetical protein [Kordia algicida]EDP98458.1 hypothetical protein KAOT1_14612 [Kordia algicida OT-1]
MNVIWTPTAELSFVKELDKISKKWSINEIIDFINLVDDFVKKLELGLIEGKGSPKTNLRSFVISKQTTLYFDVFEDTQTIELLLFWNNKDNPKELKEFLNI